jgi:hypothetical protein
LRAFAGVVLVMTSPFRGVRSPHDGRAGVTDEYTIPSVRQMSSLM